jgi:hypothetical protein
MTTTIRRLGPELLAIIERAMRDVPSHMRDLFLTDVQDRLRPLDQPDYAHVRAAVQAALSRLRDDDD